ncbi:MAG: carbamoyl phosphate synthase small subunit [Tissierellia bacterium]|nr:carbamoyl phosphate synthase small subunit [Tissierellia bacterium]
MNSNIPGKIILEDGSSFNGHIIGPYIEKVGILAHYTSYSGYQEILTDPSTYGQSLVIQYPLVGNYGINRVDYESIQSHVSHLITREICRFPNHYKMNKNLEDYLNKMKIPAITGVDVRQILNHSKSKGPLKAVIVHDGITIDEGLEIINNHEFNKTDLKFLSTPIIYEIPGNGPRIALLDLGLKQSLLKKLNQEGYHVTVLPWDTTWEEIEDLDIDAILISSGPDLPVVREFVLKQIKPNIGKYPIFGIGFGYLILGEALGMKPSLIKTGIHGIQMIKDIQNGKLIQASQNISNTLCSPEQNDINEIYKYVNLNSNAGFISKYHLILAVSFYPEGSPGPEEGQSFFATMKTMVQRRGNNA